LRLWFSDYRQATRVFRGFRIRRAQSDADWQAINQPIRARIAACSTRQCSTVC